MPALIWFLVLFPLLLAVRVWLSARTLQREDALARARVEQLALGRRLVDVTLESRDARTIELL